MFIVDALIGNWDRHNGNWGFLYNVENDSMELAPIFDCGSSMFPQADIKTMESVFSDRTSLEHRVYDIPLSAICENGKKINYFQFISSIKNKDCNKALKCISKKIDMDKINKIIDETPFIDDIQKKFFKYILQSRKERIIDFSLNKLKKHEKKQAR